MISGLPAFCHDFKLFVSIFRILFIAAPCHLVLSRLKIKLHADTSFIRGLTIIVGGGNFVRSIFNCLVASENFI